MQEEIIHYAPFTDETEIRIPEGVRQIGEKAFEDLPHVTRIDDAYGDRNLVCKFSAE